MGIIGQNIKRIRKQKGLTQKELGEMLNISQAAIGQFESDKSNPQIETLIKIAACLSVPLASLLDVHDEQQMQEMTQREIELHNEMYSVNMTEGPILDIVRSFSKLNDVGQNKVADYAKDLCSINLYLKDYWRFDE